MEKSNENIKDVFLSMAYYEEIEKAFTRMIGGTKEPEIHFTSGEFDKYGMILKEGLDITKEKLMEISNKYNEKKSKTKT